MPALSLTQTLKNKHVASPLLLLSHGRHPLRHVSAPAATAAPPTLACHTATPLRLNCSILQCATGLVNVILPLPLLLHSKIHTHSPGHSSGPRCLLPTPTCCALAHAYLSTFSSAATFSASAFSPASRSSVDLTVCDGLPRLVVVLLLHTRFVVWFTHTGFGG